MSTPEHSDDSLPERAEALLDGWPAPARGALEWEDAASRTMARVRETEVGSTPDDLLTAPLPPESGEGSIAPTPVEENDRATPVDDGEHVVPEPLDEPVTGTAPEERATPTSPEENLSPAAPAEDQPKLAEIARAVVAAGGAAASRAVAREVMLAAEERRSAPPPASRRYGAPRSGDPRPVEAAHEPAHEAAARSELPAREPREKRGGAGLIFLGGGAALALAAGAALYVSLRHGDGRGALTEASAEAPPAATATSLASSATGATAPASDPRVNAIALDVLPPASEVTRKEAANSKGEVAASGAAKDSLAFRVKSAPAGAGKIVLEERNDEAQAPQAVAKQAGAPQAAAPQAPVPQAAAKEAAPQQAGPPPTTPKGAAAPAQANAPAAAQAPPESPASRPSVGAVQAAVGAVMSGARSCLAGQDSGSKATVIFGSSGQVTSVHISGPAAGTPAEGCVRSALMGARVPAFSDPTFSASLTIRPP